MKRLNKCSSSDASLRFRPTPLASTAKATAELYFQGLFRLPAKKVEKEEEAILMIDFLEFLSGYAA